MHVRSDTVPRSMEKEVAEPMLFNVIPRHIIYFVTGERFSTGSLVYRKRRSLLPRIFHDLKDPLNPFGDRFATKPSPCNVVINGIRVLEFCPQIDEHQIASLNVRR